MATARQLDVVITKIGKATIYYTLAIGGNKQEWRIPDESRFDTSQLRIGSRYEVWTTTIMSEVYDYRKGHKVRKPQYEWVNVRELPLNAKSSTKTAKQSAFSKDLEGMVIAAPELFQWGSK